MAIKRKGKGIREKGYGKILMVFNFNNEDKVSARPAWAWAWAAAGSHDDDAGQDNLKP